MNCRLHYTKEVENRILEIAGVGRTTARKLTGNQILLPINKDNPKLATKDNVIKWAQNLIDNIHKRFRADLMGTMISIDIDRYPGAVVLKYVIPSKLIDYYEKRGEEKRNKSKQLGLDETKYNGDSLIKAKMVYNIPDDIREKYWGDIRSTIEDDNFSPSMFEDFIEYLKNCK